MELGWQLYEKSDGKGILWIASKICEILGYINIGLGLPLSLYSSRLMDQKGIESLEELDCYCDWDLDDFPNIQWDN
jgi:hypothetical protein